MGISLNQFGGNTVLNAVYIYNDITAEIDTRYLVNTTSRSITITLPSNPVRGDVIEVIDATGSANTEPTEGFGLNPAVIKPNPDEEHPITGIDGDLVLNNDGTAITLVYDGYTTWLIKQVTINTLNVNRIETTDDLPEGNNRFYYSDVKVDDRLSQLSITALGDVNLQSDLPENLDCLVYNSSEGKWVPARPIPTSTDVVSEGIVNLYYTDERVNTKLSTSSIKLFQDINFISPTINSVLTWNGVRWEDKSTDVSVWKNPNFSDELVDIGLAYYNLTDSKWKITNLSSIANSQLNLIDLKDVTTTIPLANLVDNHLLIYKDSTWQVLPAIDFASVISIEELSDVSINSGQTNDVIIFDGSQYKNSTLASLASTSLNLEDISNVIKNETITEAVLLKDSNSDWVESDFPTLASKLNLTELKDITEQPKDKSILQYEGGLNGWVYTNVNNIVGESIASNLDYSMIGKYLTNQSIDTFRDVGSNSKQNDILISKPSIRPAQTNRVINSTSNEEGNSLQLVYNGAGLFISRNPPEENQQDSFTLALNKIPPSTVYVNFTEVNTNDYVLSTATLAFSDDTPQTVTITSKLDNLGQAPKTISLTIETTNSSPLSFRNILLRVEVDIFDDFYVWEPTSVRDLPFNFTDLKDVNNIKDGEVVVAYQQLPTNTRTITEEGGLVIDSPSPITLTRSGNKEFIKIKLSTPPAPGAPRIVNVSSILLNLNITLTFEYYNWEIEQLVELSANDNTADSGVINVDTNQLIINVLDAEFSIETKTNNVSPYIINDFESNSLLGWVRPSPSGSKNEGTINNNEIEITYPPLLIGYNPVVIKLQLLETISSKLEVKCFSQGITDTIEFLPQDWNCPRYYKFYRDLPDGEYKLSIYTDDFVEVLEYTVNKKPIELKKLDKIPLKRRELDQTSFINLQNKDVEIYEELKRPTPFNNDIYPNNTQLVIRTTNLEEELYIARSGYPNKLNTTDTIKIRLSSQPASLKRINIIAYNLSVSKNFLEFTNSNWEEYQSITVSNGLSVGSGVINVSEDNGTDYYQLIYTIIEEAGRWVNKNIQSLIIENKESVPIEGGGLVGEVEQPPSDQEEEEEDIITPISPSEPIEDLSIVSISPTSTENITLNPLISIEFNQKIKANGTARLVSDGITETFNLLNNSSDLDGTSSITGNFLTIMPSTLTEDTQYSLFLDSSAITDSFNLGFPPTKVIEFTTYSLPPSQYTNHSDCVITLSGESTELRAKITYSNSDIHLTGSSSQTAKKNVTSNSDINIQYETRKDKVTAAKAVINIWGESLFSVSKLIEKYSNNSTSNLLLSGNSKSIKLPVSSTSNLVLTGKSSKTKDKLTNVETNSLYANSNGFIILTGDSSIKKLPVYSTGTINLEGSFQSKLHKVSINNHNSVSSNADLFIQYFTKINPIVNSNGILTIQGWSTVGQNKTSNSSLIIEASSHRLKQPIHSLGKLDIIGSSFTNVKYKSLSPQISTNSIAELNLQYKTRISPHVVTQGNLLLQGWSSKDLNIYSNKKSITTESSFSLEIRYSTRRNYPSSSVGSINLIGESIKLSGSVQGDKNTHTQSNLLVGFSYYYEKPSVSVANVTLAGSSQRKVTRTGNPPLIATEAITTIPKDGALDVFLTTQIQVVFNKNITNNTGIITLSKNNTLIESFDIITLAGTNSGSVNIISNYLEINPGIAFEYNTDYTVNIPDGVLLDPDNLESSGITFSFKTSQVGNLLVKQPSKGVYLSRGGNFNKEVISIKLDAPPSDTVSVFITTEDTQITTSIDTISITSNNYSIYQEVTITAGVTSFTDVSNTKIYLETQSNDSRYNLIKTVIPVEIKPVKTEKKSISLETLENYILWSKDVNYTVPANGDILSWQTDKFINSPLREAVLAEVSTEDFISYGTTSVNRNDNIAVRINETTWETKKLNLNSFSTSDLSEGNRKYYTDSRVRNYITSNIGLNELLGVSISNVNNNSILSYNTSNNSWVVKEIALPETTDDLIEGTTNKYLSISNLGELNAKNLGDINYGDPNDYDLLVWDSTNTEWRARSIKEIPLRLRDLNEVRDIAAADNQLLAWNLTQGWWEPTSISTVVDNLTTDNIEEGVRKYYSTSLFSTDFSNTIINTNLNQLKNVTGNPVEGQYLAYDGANWNPQDLEVRVTGSNLSNIDIDKTVKSIEFNKNDGLYLTDLGDSIKINHKIPYWSASAQLLTSSGTNTQVLEPGLPGQILSINALSLIQWVNPRPAFLRIQTLSGDFTLSQSDHYSFLKINDSLTLTLSDTLIKGSYLWCRISSENVSLSFATSGNAIIVSDIPNVNELHAEVLLIYEGYNLQGSAEWSIRMTNGASDISVKGLLVKTSVQSSNFIATKFTIYPIDTSLQPITLTLPDSPLDGDSIQVYDYNGSHPTSSNYPSGFGNNPLTILVGNSEHKINNGDSIILNSDNSTCTIQFDETKKAWFIINGLTDTTSVVVDSNTTEGYSNYDYYYDYLLPSCLFFNSFIHKSMSINKLNFTKHKEKLIRQSSDYLLKASDLGLTIKGLNNNTLNDYFELNQSSLEEFSVVMKVERIKDNSDIEFLDVFGYRFGIGNGRFFNRHASGKEIDIQLLGQHIAITVDPTSVKVFVNSEVVYSSTTLTKLNVKDNCLLGALSLPKYQSIRLRDFGLYSKVLTEEEILKLN